MRHAEAYHHPLLSVRGLGGATAGPDPTDPAGLRVEGATLTALRRRDGWLELRLVRLDGDPGTARIVLLDRDGQLLEAQETDLLGRPGDARSVQAGEITIPLGGWEIRTLRLRTAADR